MYAEIAAAAASIKTVTELTTLVLKAKVDSAVMQKAIESQSALIALQEAMLTLQAEHQNVLKEKEELERRLWKAELWEAEAGKYQLKEIAEQVYVYELNPDEALHAPRHWLCTRCFLEKEKSILQRNETAYGSFYFECPRCGTKIRKTPPPTPTSSSTRTF